MPLNNVARAAIEELRGLGVSDLTPDEVVRLNDLGAAQLAAGKAEGGITLTPPVGVGNVVLHPLTCAAADFISRFQADTSRDGGGFLGAWTVPFALAHGRNPEFLASILTPRDLTKAVKAWVKTLSATEDEVARAALRVISGDESERRCDARASLHSFCGYIEAFDAQSASVMRSLGLGVLAAMGEGGEERRSDDGCPDDGYFWKKYATELAAMTGVPPSVWYAEDCRLARLAFRKAAERRGAVSGVAGPDGAPSAEFLDAIRAMRSEIAAIKKIRDTKRGAR